MKVYLDNNRLTPVDPQVREVMEPFFNEPYGDLPALHDFGAATRKAYNEAVEKCYAGLHASDKDTLVFTSGAAEAHSTLFMSTYTRFILTGRKNNIIVSEREPLPILELARFLEEQGCRVNYLPANRDGIIDPETLTDYITPRTALVSVSMVDAESGAINPVEEIANICRRYEVPFHTDATQALGRIPVDLQRLEADYLSFSSETLHAPVGTGGLFLKEGAELLPLIPGGRMRAEALRGGPLNLPGIVGLGKAMEIASDALGFEVEDMRDLRDRLEEALRALPGVEILVPWALRTPNTVLAAFRGVESEAMLYELNREGIAAYSTTVHPFGEWRQRPLTDILELDPVLRHSTVGFALNRNTTEEEIDHTIEAVKKALEYLRSFSTLDEYAKEQA